MYAYVVTARQRMSGVDRFDLPGFASPSARLTSRPLAGKLLCKIFLARSERRQLPVIDLISFSFFDFAESMYPGLCLRLYPRSSKIVSTNWSASKDRARAASIGSRP